jgi:hypothetical protein
MEHSMLTAFYKGDRAKWSRPRLLRVGVIIIEKKYALALMIEGGTLQFLDALSL